MRRGLYDLIVNQKYYARFLRTNHLEDAVRAVQHPKDKNKDWSSEEQIEAVETCRNHNQGTVSLLKWRDKQTAITANMAFVILSREGGTIPPDLLQAMTENVEQWIQNYEDKSSGEGDGFDELESQYAKLRTEIYRRNVGTTMAEVFKIYAAEWNIPATEINESWEVLKERYKTRRKREIKGLKERLRELGIRMRQKRQKSHLRRFLYGSETQHLMPK